MASFGTSADFNRQADAAGGQQQKREEEARAAQQQLGAAALELGRPVFDFFTSLPAAIVAAERTELARLTALDPGHRRATQVGSTIDALMSAAPAAKRVVARATRALDVARSRAQGFHGFVTASDGTPLKDAVVRLGDASGARAKTADDGYFFIPIPLAKAAGAATRAGESTAAGGAHVTITSHRGQTLYEDPVPVNTAAGFAYREYVVDATESDGRTYERPDA